MSKGLFTPVNQIRFTNVVIVRLKAGGKRFELAAYPNKINDWRNKIETSIDEVLQSQYIFTNVSKGIVAKREELQKAFQTTDQEEIIKKILSKGEIQVSNREREQKLETTFRDIATIVSEKCVSIETNRPLPVGLIEKAMRESHFSVHPNRTAKQQSLEVIKILKDKLGITRAPLRIKITCRPQLSDFIETKLQDKIIKVEKNSKTSILYEIVCLIDPGNLRLFEEETKNCGDDDATCEVLSLGVYAEGDTSIENVKIDKGDEEITQPLSNNNTSTIPQTLITETPNKNNKKKQIKQQQQQQQEQEQTSRRGQKQPNFNELRGIIPGEMEQEEDDDYERTLGRGKKKKAKGKAKAKAKPKAKAGPKPFPSEVNDDEREDEDNDDKNDNEYVDENDQEFNEKVDGNEPKIESGEGGGRGKVKKGKKKN